MALNYPPFIEWEVTPSCNHNCIHCYNYWRSDEALARDQKFDCETDSKYYCKIAMEIVKSKPVAVAITGGEPLLVFDKIREAIDILLNAGITVTVNSNATLMTSDKINFFSKRGINFFVSLPCANAVLCDKITGVHDSLKRITKAVLDMKQGGINVSTNTVVSKINLPYLYMTGQYVHDVLSQSYFCATRACLPANSKEAFKGQVLNKQEFIEMLSTLIRIKEEYNMKIDSARAYSLCSFGSSEIISEFAGKRQCAGGKFSFVVTSKGDIKACAMDLKSYGNILEEPFGIAISRMTEWQQSMTLPNECHTCRFNRICNGGCRIDALSTYGEFSHLDPLSDPNFVDKIEFSAETKDFNIDHDQQFSLASGLVVVQEDKCIRVSKQDRYQFINAKAYQTISEMGIFGLETFLNKFQLDRDSGLHILWSLLTAGILVSC